MPLVQLAPLVPHWTLALLHAGGTSTPGLPEQRYKSQMQHDPEWLDKQAWLCNALLAASLLE